MARQVLHVDCDCFYAAVEMRDKPEYKDVPIAIGGARDLPCPQVWGALGHGQ